VRSRSRDEVRRRLGQAGFDPDEIAAALDDLERVGLLDDDRFARDMVADQTTRRRSGERAIRAALRQKGIPDEAATRALAGAGDELSRAVDLATSRALRMGSLSVEVASRRLFGLLARRGYAPGLAREAVKSVLADVFSGHGLPESEA
jgi:regulatory protein